MSNKAVSDHLYYSHWSDAGRKMISRTEADTWLQNLLDDKSNPWNTLTYLHDYEHHQQLYTNPHIHEGVDK